MVLKTCACCMKALPLDLFQADAQKHDGFRSWCKPCRKLKNRGYVEQWKERRKGVILTEKLCSICKVTKPISTFVKDSCRPDGFHVYCSECRAPLQRKHARAFKMREPERKTRQDRGTWLRSKYKLSLELFEKLIEEQGGVCMICKVAPSGIGTNHWNVDHDHVTGRRRGLLCGNCNRGLGLFKDDPARCEEAASYLRRHQN